MRNANDIFGIVKKEIRFEAARASGPGGQNVNKRNTKVTGLWNFSVSRLIDNEGKKKIANELKNKVLSGRVLVVVSQKHRSQNDNKKEVIGTMAHLVAKVLKVKILRISTKPSKTQKEKRLSEKKRHSKIKKLRKNKSG
jgi:ribosome-associated protein